VVLLEDLPFLFGEEKREDFRTIIREALLSLSLSLSASFCINRSA
jgi:hypothetical protein